MLNPFPELLDLAFFAPFFLRMALGLALFITSFHQVIDRKYQAAQRFVKQWPKNGVHILWITAVVETVLGLAFVAGFFVQYAAIITIVFATGAALSKKYQIATQRNVLYYVLVLAIAMSLLLTGAGIFAYDLPL